MTKPFSKLSRAKKPTLEQVIALAERAGYQVRVEVHLVQSMTQFPWITSMPIDKWLEQQPDANSTSTKAARKAGAKAGKHLAKVFKQGKGNG